MALKKASDFHVLPGEANFGPPIEMEVVGGMHIAPEIITRSGPKFYMTRWPHGLPRHETNHVVRFPHGLMRYGESIEDCARRLVREQLGMTVDSIQVINLDSYMDEMKHWHLEPWVLAGVSGTPKVPEQAAEIIEFTLDDVPELSLWSASDLRDAVGRYL